MIIVEWERERSLNDFSTFVYIGKVSFKMLCNSAELEDVLSFDGRRGEGGGGGQAVATAVITATQHLLSLHCPRCAVRVRPYGLAKCIQCLYDPQLIYEV